MTTEGSVAEEKTTSSSEATNQGTKVPPESEGSKEESRVAYWQSKADQAQASVTKLEQQINDLREKVTDYVPENRREEVERELEVERLRAELEKERMARVEADIRTRRRELAEKYPRFGKMFSEQEQREVIENALRANNYRPESIEAAVKISDARLASLEEKVLETHGVKQTPSGESSAAPKDEGGLPSLESFAKLGTNDKRSVLQRLGLVGPKK